MHGVQFPLVGQLRTHGSVAELLFVQRVTRGSRDVFAVKNNKGLATGASTAVVDDEPALRPKGEKVNSTAPAHENARADDVHAIALDFVTGAELHDVFWPDAERQS